eukprot:4236861-Prymnesium_polylepis.1
MWRARIAVPLESQRHMIEFRMKRRTASTILRFWVRVHDDWGFESEIYINDACVFAAEFGVADAATSQQWRVTRRRRQPRRPWRMRMEAR